MGQFDIKLRPTALNTFHYAVEEEDGTEDVQFDPTTSNTLNMVINGLDHSKRYRIRVLAANIFGKSGWSPWSDFQRPTNRDTVADDPEPVFDEPEKRQPVFDTKGDKVMTAPPDIR